MRRIASIFSSRRSDKSDAASTAGDSKPAAHPQTTPRHPKKIPRLFGTVSRLNVANEPPMPILDQGHSSSSSSSGSASLRTPDDDRASPMAPPLLHTPHKSWVPFIGMKKSHTAPSISPHSSNTPTPKPLPPRPRSKDADSEDDTSVSLSSESETHPASKHIDHRLSPIEFVTTLTTNNIEPGLSPPPLLHLPRYPLFPRSCNSVRSLAFRDTLESTMHKKRLLRRLQRRHELLPSEQRTLSAFGSRPASAAKRRTLPQPDESARFDLKYVEPHSRGLKRWVNRPYFEERMAMWVPDVQSGSVVAAAVKGSGFGVWALEISEGLELLAGVTFDEVQSPHIGMWDPPSSASSSSSQLSAPPPATAKQLPFKALPSPLRNDAAFELPVPSVSSSRTIRPVSIPESPSTPKRGVRFAEGDKQDQIPLEYVTRIKKRREEKAKFLQEERERRRHEEERLKHEAERRQWQLEREKWEKERRAIEEERKRKMYAEEVLAARARREGLSHALATPVAERRGRERRDSYARPAYDTRRPSEAADTSRTRNASASSSRAHSPTRSSVNGSPHFPSRPASTYSTPISSAEDVRQRDARSSRRGSMASFTGSERMSMYPYGWPSGPMPVPPIPPVPVFPTVQMMPMMPQFAMDMPLLPPAPPFMMQQYGPRSRSPSSSPRQASARLPSSSSSERVHKQGSSPARSHHRHSSSDDFRRQMQGGSGSPRPSERTSSHPRSASHTNSWGAPAMSSPYMGNRPSSNRRQTAFS
ncbi:hypothetical protein DENSPDRAFT_831262 [Dentipellis sp. KUC8613]|nr:hypothetical protein DENSPDRAFT_831262 [Dentipellis sp. KUC8613]